MELPEIPGYAYVRKIGEGGFCEVHLAEHETFCHKVAVKIPKTEEYPIEYEAIVLEWLHAKNIKGIVPYYGLQQTNKGSALILGYAEESLEDRLKKPINFKNLTEKWKRENGSVLNGDYYDAVIYEELSSFRSLVKTVEEVNRAFFIHGDLKPSNILLSGDSCWLSDFGFSIANWHYRSDSNLNEFQRTVLQNLLLNGKYEGIWKNFPAFSPKIPFNMKDKEPFFPEPQYLELTIKGAKKERSGDSRLFSKTQLEETVLRAGTPSYMAPEMFEGKVSQKEDVYALGKILERILLVGLERGDACLIEIFPKPPFTVLISNQQKKQFIPIRADFEKKMRSVCNSLLSYDLNERPDIFSLSERIDKGLSEERSLLMRKNKINK